MEDSIPAVVTVIDTVHRIIADNVTAEALEKSQEFYSKAFATIQDSFSIFVCKVEIIILLLGLFIGLLSFLNFKSVKNSKKDLKDTEKKISNFENSFNKGFEEIKKEFQILKKELQDKINEFEDIKKQFEVLKNDLYHFLERKFRPDSTINVEISIKSGTFKKTKTGVYECNSDDYGKYYNKIVRFDENGFEIIALERPLRISYKKIEEWEPDDKQPDRKISLYLKKALVLDENEEHEKLEDFNKIWCCCLSKG